MGRSSLAHTITHAISILESNSLQRPNGLKLLFDPKIKLREKAVFMEGQGFSQSQIGMLTMALLIVVNELSLMLRPLHI